MGSLLTPADIAYQEAHIADDQGPRLLAVSIFLITITTIVVALRFVARRVRKLPLLWDDWLSIGGLVMVILMCVENIISVHFGIGKHLLATDPATGYRILEVGFYLSLTYTLGHWFIKMSILFFYIRLFSLRMKWFRIAVYTTMTYVTGWAISLIFIIFLQCRPISYFWTRFDISANPPAIGKCFIDSSSPEVSTSVLNTIADFAILVLPIIVIAGLQLNLHRKIALICVFLVGCFACIAGILRLISTTTTIGDGKDTTYNTTSTYLWTAVEASVGLMCACFPIIGPMFNLLRDKLRSRTSSYLDYSSGSKNSHLRPWQLVGGANNAPEYDTLPLHHIPADQGNFGPVSKQSDVISSSRQDISFERGEKDSGMAAVVTQR